MLTKLALDHLGLRDRLEAGDAELLAVARLLRATERHEGVDGAVRVDPHGAGLDAGRDAARAVAVRRPHRAAEADLNLVREPDRLVEVGVANDRQRGAKLLLLHQLVLRLSYYSIVQYEQVPSLRVCPGT